MTKPTTPKRVGRPALPKDDPRAGAKPRTIRLDDARWLKYQQLGREWLERAIDRANVEG